jgi:glycosyltransferase involved in cell wall biosynthesis
MSADGLAADSKNWGVFCLPSLREPWGVVIHECTCSGLPVICSDSVGAADVLVKNDMNGYVFKSGDQEALKQVILQLMNKSDAELIMMGDRSHELSKMNSPVIAAHSFMRAIKDR